MSLAAKVRALEKRMADARALGPVEEAMRVLVRRDDLIDSITTHFGEAMTPTHRVVVTRRMRVDTDEMVTARHDAKVVVAALNGSLAQLFAASVAPSD